jgi:hypothetical protein
MTFAFLSLELAKKARFKGLAASISSSEKHLPASPADLSKYLHADTVLQQQYIFDNLLQICRI